MSRLVLRTLSAQTYEFIYVPLLLKTETADKIRESEK